jgi:hypothetical protein
MSALDAQKRTPDIKDYDANWFVSQLDFAFPVWIEHELYVDELKHLSEEGKASRLLRIMKGLVTKLDKAIAGGAADAPSVRFPVWRHLSARARKQKRIDLVASIYIHPEFDKVWLLISKE